MEKHIEELIRMASIEKDAMRAMQFSQAANNAANAYATLCEIKRSGK